MTIETKAREWAEKEYPLNKGDEYLPGRTFITEDRKKAERAYLAGAAEAVRWVPVSERLPEVGEYVWILIGENLTPFKGKRLHNGWSCFFADGQINIDPDIRDVKYWQPISSLHPHPEK